jgi:hypothetical protein
MEPLRFNAEVPLTVPGDELFALADDLPRLVSLERHLAEARWVTPGAARAGSAAEIVAEVPFTVPLVRRLLGRTHGTVRVIKWDAPVALVAVFSGPKLEGRVDVRVEDRGDRAIAIVRGQLEPRQRWAAPLLRPLHPLLEALIGRSIQRGARRVQAALSAEGTESRDAFPSGAE